MVQIDYGFAVERNPKQRKIHWSMQKPCPIPKYMTQSIADKYAEKDFRIVFCHGLFSFPSFIVFFSIYFPFFHIFFISETSVTIQIPPSGCANINSVSFSCTVCTSESIVRGLWRLRFTLIVIYYAHLYIRTMRITVYTSIKV